MPAQRGTDVLLEIVRRGLALPSVLITGAVDSDCHRGGLRERAGRHESSRGPCRTRDVETAAFGRLQKVSDPVASGERGANGAQAVVVCGSRDLRRRACKGGKKLLRNRLAGEYV